jgi:hypothetical protein
MVDFLMPGIKIFFGPFKGHKKIFLGLRSF